MPNNIVTIQVFGVLWNVLGICNESRVLNNNVSLWYEGQTDAYVTIYAYDIVDIINFLITMNMNETCFSHQQAKTITLINFERRMHGSIARFVISEQKENCYKHSFVWISGSCSQHNSFCHSWHFLFLYFLISLISFQQSLFIILQRLWSS